MQQAGAPEHTAWSDAAFVAAVLAVDPAGVAGVSLRAEAGPVRARWLGLLRALLPAEAPMRRVPLGIGDGRLLGGLDLAATLRAGRPVAEQGLLAESHGGVVVLAMAERLGDASAARLSATLDFGEVVAARDNVTLRSAARLGVVLLDEGLGEDERPPAALLDRLAFWLDLHMIAPREPLDQAVTGAEIAAARQLLPQVRATDAAVVALCGTALALGIDSARGTLLALHVARIAAALSCRTEITDQDAALAARLVLAPRATQMPAPAPDAPAPDEPPPDTEAPDSQAGDTQARDEAPQRPERREASSDDDAQSDTRPRDDTANLEDLVLAAAKAAIPPNLLAQLAMHSNARSFAARGRSGSAIQKAGSRGRAAGVRAGEPRQGARLNIVETLRAAAPWQKLRQANEVSRVRVCREDFRITHVQQRTETTIIFVVDASRSSAVNRLAEAKGAVEMLLADCYARRDRVAVLAFRGRGADLLLPPTRSLVRAKRQLAGLPGGGGTPLAAGLDAALLLAQAASRRGETPTIVVLTDGRANVARDGSTGRDRAEADALAAAKKLRGTKFPSLLVDTAPRPQPQAQRFAAEMGARYLPLPLCQREHPVRRRPRLRAERAARDMSNRLDLERDGRDWPNREASRVVEADGVRFHVQVMGKGPVLLLLHGTGAATHSWRDLLPILARHFRVVAPDLPGHGFTAAPPQDRLSVPGMAQSLTALLRQLDVTPVLAAGHSAGAPLLVRMTLDGTIAPRGLVGLNAAIMPLGGVATPIFSPLSKLLARISLLPELFAWHVADERVVRKLLAGTGSTIEPAGVALYRRVMKNPHHAAAALAMMANWDLRPIRRDLPCLTVPMLLIVGENDRTIPPRRGGPYPRGGGRGGRGGDRDPAGAWSPRARGEARRGRRTHRSLRR